MPHHQFDASQELANLRALKKVRKKRIYRPSKLDRYEDKIVALRHTGATFADIQFYLESRHNLTVAWSTVQRWFSKYGQL